MNIMDNPKTWEQVADEQRWLEELAGVLKPFIRVADTVHAHNLPLDQQWVERTLTVEEWLLLRKIVTGTTDPGREV